MKKDVMYFSSMLILAILGSIQWYWIIAIGLGSLAILVLDYEDEKEDIEVNPKHKSFWMKEE